MPYVGQMQLVDGTSVLLEVSEGPEGGLDRVSRGGDALHSAAETLSDALARVRPALNTMVEGVRALASCPDIIAVDFGIKLTAEAGVVVAKAATEANFTVHLEWKRDQAPEAP